MNRKKTKFPWPHHVDEENKTVYTHVASGWPTVMVVPQTVERYYPGYKSDLVSQEYLTELSNKEV